MVRYLEDTISMASNVQEFKGDICRDMMTLIGLELLQIERALQDVAKSILVLLSVQPRKIILKSRRKKGNILQVMRNM